MKYCKNKLLTFIVNIIMWYLKIIVNKSELFMDCENYGEINSLLNKEYNEFVKIKNNISGYPENQKFFYKNIKKFLNLSLNNVGDSFSASNYPLNTLNYEAEVISYIADLYNKKSDYWGYITSGGTESNLFAIHLARSKFSKAIVLFSEHSHYSVLKSAKVTRSKYSMVSVLSNGEINYEDFSEKVQAHSKSPLIIVLNLGTTMTGAIDNIKLIKEILIKNNVSKYYIHCDAALHGFLLPFSNIPESICLDEIDSISISGHKFIGSPLPCGIFLTHSHTINIIKKNIDYLKANDCTLLGSREGISALILWNAIKQNTKEEFQKLVDYCYELCEYAVAKMLKVGISAWANRFSPIVVFPRPTDETIKKWSIAPYKNIAHIITMPHMTRKKIDQIISDLVNDMKKN